MNYLLDTNHWSFIQRRQPSVLARIARLPEDTTLYMPIVAQAELLAGVELVENPARRLELRKLYEQVVGDATEVLHIDSQVAEQYARIYVQLRRDGHPVETNDMWVAAIALAHDLTVVSNDSHFESIRGLRVEDWTRSPASSG